VGVNVRAAIPDDLDWLVGQLRSFSKFFGTRQQLFGDESFVRSGMLTLIEKHLVLISEKSGRDDTLHMPTNEPVGFIAGIVTPHVFNPNVRVLCEYFWWVDEAHRGGRAGYLLLESFLDWGHKNADWITFAVETNSPLSEDVLVKRGFHLQEKSYLLETKAALVEA